MEFDELKEKVKDFIKKNPDYFDRGLEELKRAKICYENNFNFLNYLEDLKKKGRLSNAYVIPYVLGLTEKIDLSKPIELRQVYEGDSGGLDVDTDISTSGKPKVKAHLEEEYGKDRVLSVGTYMQIGMATAIKDILRKEGVDFKTSNAFCAELDNDLSFEENMKIYKDKFPDLYALYNKYQVLLDFVPKLSNVIRSCIPYYQKVNTDSGEIPISLLNPNNDKILYLSNKKEFKETKNYQVVKNGIKDVYEIELDDGTLVRTTEEHEFFTPEGVKKLKDLRRGDKLYKNV